MIKKLFITVLLSFLSTQSFSESIQLLSAIDYDPDSRIQQNVRTECINLGKKLSDFTQQYAAKHGIDVELVNEINTNSSGKTLEVYMTEAVSSGNAFIGHRKYVAIRGTLWENGEKIAEFTGGRYSGGGAFGGYKGSCSVLGRCVKALGKDVAGWLKSPNNNASLGDG